MTLAREIHRRLYSTTGGTFAGILLTLTGIALGGLASLGVYQLTPFTLRVALFPVIGLVVGVIGMSLIVGGLIGGVYAIWNSVDQSSDNNVRDIVDSTGATNTTSDQAVGHESPDINDNSRKYVREAMEEEDRNIGISDIYDRARAAHKEGRYEQAEALYREALDMDPEDGNTHRNLGILLKEQEQYGEAEDHYRRALEIDPNDSKTQKYLEILLRERKRYDRRETHRQRVQDTVYSIRSDLDEVENLVDDGDFDEIEERLAVVDNRLDSASDSATFHGFDSLCKEIAYLEERCENLRSEISSAEQMEPESSGIVFGSIDFANHLESAQTALRDGDEAAVQYYEAILETLEETVAEFDEQELSEAGHATIETVRSRGQRGYVQARLIEIGTRLQQAVGVFHDGEYQTAHNEFTGISHQLEGLQDRINDDAEPIVPLYESLPTEAEFTQSNYQDRNQAKEHGEPDGRNEKADDVPETEEAFETLADAIDACQTRCDRFKTIANNLRD